VAAALRGGRRGPRRTRVEECAGALRAEEVYRVLIAECLDELRPEGRGTVTWRVSSNAHVVAWCVRRNLLWRHGRVFLLCPRCAARVARVYVPVESAAAACRRCWGLSYVSRSRHYGSAVPNLPPGSGALDRTRRTHGRPQRGW
jgi:hypothetical protein